MKIILIMTSICTSLLLCLLLICFAAAEVKIDLDIDPKDLDVRSKNKMNFTLSCAARETSRRYRRYGRDTSRILTRLRILMESEDGTWQPMTQLSNLEPSHVFVNPAFPNVDSVGSISSNLLSRDSGLSAKWYGPTVDAVKRFRCDAITFNHDYSDYGSYHWDDTRIKTDYLNSYSFAQLSALEKESLLKQIRSTATEMGEKDISVTRNKIKAGYRTELGEILRRIKSRLAEATNAHAEKIDKLTQHFNTLLTQARENQTREMRKFEDTLVTALKGSFLMLWPKGTYALPMPSTGCPSTNGQYWKEGVRRHHTESVQRNEDQVSPSNHLRQPVLYRSEEKFFVYQRFCVKTESNTFGPAWPKGSYCINAVNSCPSDDFKIGHIFWDEEDFRSDATISGTLPSGSFEDTRTKFVYCCRQDGSADAPVDMPRFQPFYLYRYKGKCQQVVGMKVTEEYIHFDSENSNNADKAEFYHPDVELNNLVLHLCYYEQSVDRNFQ